MAVKIIREKAFAAGMWYPLARSMVTRIGPLATISREPGQARKGAAAAVDLGAGVWLVRVATLYIRIM